MKKKLDSFKVLMISFISYAFIGWLYEVGLFLVRQHHFYNRGFLYGPYLPIYGFGGLVIYAVFKKLKEKPVKIGKVNIRPLLLIIYIAAMAMAVELLSTYICDLFKVDWRELWTYEGQFMNFQGRIALKPGLYFGIIGVIVLYFVQPLIEKVKKSNNKILNIIIWLIILIFFIDCIIHIFTGSTYVGPA